MMNKILLICLLAFASALDAQPVTKFAVIGDYGLASASELSVSQLVKSWNPDFVITLGDNNYEDGEASTIDVNIGQYYHEFISPYTGSYGPGDSVNRFFPSLGNHDWRAPGALPYLNYFTLPGNERYYDFIRGNVHLFCINSSEYEPDGMDSSSAQAQWLKTSLMNSSQKYNLVYFHYPPYSSSEHGSIAVMQWPFKKMGSNSSTGRT